MRARVVAVGRAKRGPERDLYETYAARIRWPLNLHEVEEKKNLSGDELKQKEGELLLAQIPDGAFVVALDERGKSLSSREFASIIENNMTAGRADHAFVIGGADGLSDAVRNRADLLISFGRMTWPHMLVRAMLAEQIYRAHQILAGHPYHRD